MFDITKIISRVKGKRGITSTARDEYFKILAESVLSEMQNIHGIELDGSRLDYLDFLADFCNWRHDSRDKSGIMPLDLQRRLNNYKFSKE